jgi:hypothetical protein
MPSKFESNNNAGHHWESENEFSGEDVPMKNKKQSSTAYDDDASSSGSVDKSPLMEVLAEQETRKSQAVVNKNPENASFTLENKQITGSETENLPQSPSARFTQLLGEAKKEATAVLSELRSAKEKLGTVDDDKTPKTDSGESSSPLLEVLNEMKYSLDDEEDPTSLSLEDPADHSLQSKIVKESASAADATKNKQDARRIIRLYNEAKKVQTELRKNGNDMDSEGLNEYCVRVAKMNLDTLDKEGWNPRKMAQDERRKAKKDAKTAKAAQRAAENKKAMQESRDNQDRDIEGGHYSSAEYPEAQNAAAVGLITGQKVDLYNENNKNYDPNAKTMGWQTNSALLFQFLCFVFGASLAITLIYFVLWMFGLCGSSSSHNHELYNSSHQAGRFNNPYGSSSHNYQNRSMSTNLRGTRKMMPQYESDSVGANPDDYVESQYAQYNDSNMYEANSDEQYVPRQRSTRFMVPNGEEQRRLRTSTSWAHGPN